MISFKHPPNYGITIMITTIVTILNNLSLKIVYGFAATLRITLDKHKRGNHHKQELLRITRTNHKARHTKIR